MKPKGTREERNRAEYVENKQKALEESLRVVAMRKTVYSHPQSRLNWVSLTGFSGEISGRVDYRNRVHPGMYLNGISDRLVEFICINAILLPTTILPFEEKIVRIFVQFSMQVRPVGTSFVHTFELPNSMLVPLHFLPLCPVK